MESDAETVKVYIIRLPRDTYPRLKWISDWTPTTMHQLCLGAIIEAVDAKVEEIERMHQVSETHL